MSDRPKNQEQSPEQDRQTRHRSRLENEGVPYRLLVETVKDYAIFMLDSDGYVASWNMGAERIKGYAADEIIGRHFSTFYPQADIESGKPARELEEAKAFGRVEDQGWRLRKDGTRFWATVVITALRDESGTLVGFAKVTRDTTTAREAERRLRESEERFRLLVDSVTEYALFMLDPAGRVVSWNSGAQRIKGYAAEEIIGKHFSIFYPEEDIENGKPDRELRTALVDGRVQDQGWRVRKDGSRFLAEVMLTAVWDENGALRGYAKVTRDVTDVRRLEEERRTLLEARVRAEETNRAKDEFLMTLSHELRTPMTSIMGWARLLTENTLSPEEAKQAISSILESSLAQATIIDDVLDVSRLITGKLRLRLSSVNVGELVRDLVTALTPAARAKKISIATDIDSHAGQVAADPDRLRQIVWNLLANAIKFSPRRSEIFLIVRRANSLIEIIVEDRGPGIPAEVLPYIFRPFVQADSSSTRRHGGLGLGLTIVRNLVELHGGTVDVINVKDGGARFCVSIPIAASVNEAVQTLPETSSAVPGVRLSGTCILFVDDHEPSRILVQSILRHAGADVSIAGSVAEALTLLEKLSPDVIITDIAMPDADGYALAAEVRTRAAAASRKAVPIMALTAFGGADERNRTRSEIFDEWLSKPIDPQNLVASVARMIGQSRPPSIVR